MARAKKEGDGKIIIKGKVSKEKYNEFMALNYLLQQSPDYFFENAIERFIDENAEIINRDKLNSKK